MKSQALLLLDTSNTNIAISSLPIPGDIKLQLGVDLKVSPFDLFTNNRVTDLYVSLYGKLQY